MSSSFLFLGTGASTGTPVIGCTCAVCLSNQPHNRRLRPSGLLTIGNRKILIDCGPDFRQQAILHHIDHLDALLLTHVHFDHVAGIDELRVFFFRDRKPLDCVLSDENYDAMRQRYSYLFEPNDENSSLRAEMRFRVLSLPSGVFDLKGIKIEYFSFSQYQIKVIGFRVGHFAYISDIRDFNDEIFKSLENVQKLVISAIDWTPSRAHFSIDEAIRFAGRAGAKETWLTHLSHHLDHDSTERLLPPNIYLGYDGLAFDIS